MSNYVLTCCSTADLSIEYLKKRNINYIGFHYIIDGKDYLDDLGQTIPYKDFYNLMRSGADTKTSQVNVDEFISFFEPFLKKGLDILHVSLSSGISSAFNSANIAQRILLESYPNRKIIIIDSLAASSGYGLLMDKIADQRDKNLPISQLQSWIEDNKLNLHHWFYSTDLSYYVKGGRITQAAGFIGSILRMCPLLNMNDKGMLIPRFKVVGKKRVMSKIVDKMIEYAYDNIDYSEKCFISHADCLDDALEVARNIEKTFPKLNGKVEIFNVGTTIGSHTGPGTLALFFWGTKRSE
ncbi:DegV family protein [Haploplasma axanthum]|uniref:DegV-like protein n=1 Tax=Haploplasma axanthum TaxID=29552 RepID=A0A449BFT0_HAPAX|nr:DegV family protein [Haploplasma axanthum]VEU81160.1 degV-like protein [Haploplasma axanthum]